MKLTLSLITLLLFMTFSAIPVTEAQGDQLQVAFVRNNDLWINVDGEEHQLTEGELIRNPSWSYNGKSLAFTKGSEERKLWVYKLDENKMVEVYDSTDRFEWSPTQNKLAFLSNGVLNVTDVSQLQATTFENVALGVGSFSWAPNGKEFLVSSTANLLPTGWTSVELFKVPIDANLNREKINHFFTLPKDVFAVMTSTFKWSNDGKWISFLGIPTASIAMDMNTLYVLSEDGVTFQQLGEMLFFDEWFHWAPFSNRIAFIEGEGRFVVKNKHLIINEFPVQQGMLLTPSGFAERGFTWIDGVNLVVSRAKESEWSNDPVKRPRPKLYHINIVTNKQEQLTSPLAVEADYMPVFLQRNKKLAWIRSDADHLGTIYLADENGQNKQAFIENVGDGTLYEDSYGWSKIVSFYE